MKQITALPMRPKIPTIASQLRELEIGEKARLELTGCIYGNYQATRSKLRRKGVGDWVHEFTDDGLALIITRTK